MIQKEILEGLEKIHSDATLIEQEIKPYAIENEGLKCMFSSLFNTLDAVSETMSDLIEESHKRVDRSEAEEISRDNQIKMFIHCAECLEEIPRGVSPREFSNIEAGWTVSGLQLWCKRHEKNIVNIDFEGQRHPSIS